MQVKVFRNLTKGCYSIQARGPKGFRTVAHADSVMLDDVIFKVSEAGRQRVLETGKKQVHAFVCGELVGFTGEPRRQPDDAETYAELINYRMLLPETIEGWMHDLIDIRGVHYNPRKAATFMSGGSPIMVAGKVVMLSVGVFAETLSQAQYNAAETYAVALCDLRRARTHYRSAEHIADLKRIVWNASAPDDRTLWAAIDRVRSAFGTNLSIQWAYQALDVARLFNPSKQ